MSNADQVALFARLAVAIVLGGAIGLEREFRGHEAGVRTGSLVCVGAALFGEIGAHLGDARVAAAVVQGIGFLGAGLIFQRHSGVHGITTAATMWVVAGLGLLVSERLWVTALLLTAAIVLLLELFPISNWVFDRGKAMRARKVSAARGDAGPDIG
jgi:putative Mg2+ transporter-C (MgtC) family protein